MVAIGMNGLMALACLYVLKGVAFGQGFESIEFELQNTEPGFELMLPRETGVLFQNQVPEYRHLTNQIVLNGAGVATADFDRDGLCDLYFCATDGDNTLYKNLGGWKFKEVAQGAGVNCRGLTSTGAVFGDLNNDGWPDLIVNTLGQGTHVFMNQGDGRFMPQGKVLNPGKAGMTSALGDVDGDGFLDLYIANYRTSGLMDLPNARATFKQVNGKTIVATLDGVSTDTPGLRNRFVMGQDGRIIEQGESDQLYLNRSGMDWEEVSMTDGRFLDEKGKSLTEIPYEWGLAAMFRDINQDGLPDLYVCNDFDAGDRIWLNQGAGVFKHLPRTSIRKGSRYSMAVDFADINRDGLDDFLVLDMMSRDHEERQRFIREKVDALVSIRDPASTPDYSYNTLQLNRGQGTYAEIAHYSGVAASDWSWVVSFLDVDLDGFEDVLIGNGVQRAARDLDVIDYLQTQRAKGSLRDHQIFQLRRMFPVLKTPNAAFHNGGNLRFHDSSVDWGFDIKEITTGMALADLDNDGDLDVVLNNFNAPAVLLMNKASAPRVQVRLRSEKGNRFGVGARIRVRAEGMPDQEQEIVCGGKYLSSDQPVRVFAVGPRAKTVELKVSWPDGSQSLYENMPVNRIYTLSDHPARKVSISKVSEASSNAPWFEDQSHILKGVTHVEDAFDDLARQPTLPWVQSELGPGLAWVDLDQDGWEDLVLGAARGGRIQFLKNHSGARFEPVLLPGLSRPFTRDTGGLIAMLSEINQGMITALSNYQDGLAIGHAIESRAIKDPRPRPILPATDSASGPLAMADIDRDGDLDLFVGGTVKAGRYPEPADSMILLCDENGTYTRSDLHSEVFKGVGLVRGAVFTDFNNDTNPDLVLACHWGPVRLFQNENARFHEVTEQYGLDTYSGWWNGVQAADFNGDGRMDLVVSNLGKNTEYETYTQGRISLYYGDWNNDNVIEILEIYEDDRDGKEYPIRSLSELKRSFSFLSTVYKTNRSFANATAREVLGDYFNQFEKLDGLWRASTVFMNRGDHFEAIPLPAEAQFSTALGVAVADFNGDGNADIYLGQNFYPLEPGRPRQDAGSGLLLTGDGLGRFTVVKCDQSGILVEGQQRAVAVGDYDKDTRPDLAVALNNGALRLFRNMAPGENIAVRVHAGNANPLGVGARVRLTKGDWKSALQEIHMGSGYLSQNSAVLHFAPLEPPYRIELKMPDGRERILDVETTETEFLLELD